MPVPVRADVVVPVRADVVGGKVELSRCDRRRSWGELPLSSYQTLSFVQVLCRCDRRRSWDELPLFSCQTLSFVLVLSRDDVNHFYISFKLVVISAFYVCCKTIRSTEPSSIGRATCDDFAVKSDCVDFLAVLSFVKR